ncbi:S4 domain protein YaaA [Alteracholeplasma palmae J233]|uniref:S4 domain protein YaaA n=1 Tax=Alteracholeplasma palmae (strain ATCC 49389 / J233) TaxID=1318466 RepID=U4KQT1_ALTPJ|nr:RNA-binding S4 domain-containing protein [Alteracholeplasma palmae]CCV63581.1 S4 domain protein YaaA [Alteracholeplasma palmae J233]
MQEFILRGEFITIAQFLKVNDYITSGGQTKFFLVENEVLLNGIPIIERKKKLKNGDVVTVNKNKYVITYD